ncbi:MAG: hypothetical protein BIFFINMI_02779 [Phycisphaerae bacterium]|nr:hypothetical protein [Phycisphaerae bacterium]
MKRRVAQLPLHGGKAPPWLFKRMTRLAGGVTMAVCDRFGPEEMLRRLADPWWFQAFGCVLGFDWHSSGLTTVTCGAMKEAARLFGDEMGLIVAGGKGGTSRKTPHEIADAADRHAITGGDRLIFASRMSAKVDSAAVQDGYQLYHHSFFLTPSGAWCVVQQGMSDATGCARRYHWLGETVDDFVCEPHQGIGDQGAGDGDRRAGRRSQDSQGLLFLPDPRPLTPDPSLLNMVAREAQVNRDACAALVRGRPDALMDEVHRLTEGPTLFAPRHHPVLPADINAERLRRIVVAAHERHPQDFVTLLGTEGVGPAAVRSLSLLAELIYQAPASHRDPTQPPPASPLPSRERKLADTSLGRRKWADYSYAHGGKDGHPFPVDRATYDRNIALLIDAVREARVGQSDKADALRRLASMERSAAHDPGDAAGPAPDTGSIA